MNTDGFRFGAHTVTHPILSSLESRAALEREIVGSKLRLEEKLAGPVAQFSYPNGTKNDISATVVQTVERAGFASAVVADGSINVRPVHPYLLKRNAVEPSTPESVFGSDITGFRAVLRAGWRRAQRDYKAGDIS
jgi:peptidoglycan/xylan/chitin deacetylase (PgdA/CDA1 family)